MSKPNGLHPQLTYRVDRVGNEREPVLVIDNFLDRAELLIDGAETFCKFGNDPGNFYPGMIAPVPGFYTDIILGALGGLICATFDQDQTRPVGIKSVFSMVLTPPDQLQPIQRIPHFDSLNRSDLAAVHYLCSADKGGTSLYRHRATGFESVDNDRVDDYKKHAAHEMVSAACNGKYMNGSNEFFEQIGSYEAIFNRMIMYRSTSLHSGNIAPDFNLDPNPRTGRLTLNTFIYGR